MLARQLLFLVLAGLFVLSCDSSVNSGDEEEEEKPDEGVEEVYIPENTATENVVVITLDGVRWQEVFGGADSTLVRNRLYISGDYNRVWDDYWSDDEDERRKMLMPFFWNELVNIGKIYGNRKYDNKVSVTNSSLKSFPGYAEIWNGYADRTITANKPPVNNNQTIIEFLSKQSGFEGNKIAITAAASSFTDLFHESENNFTISAGHKDLTVYNKTIRLMENDKPRFVYMAINKTDHWAHESEYDTYLNLIHEADEFIKGVWDFIEQDSFYKGKTTLFITTDHGRGVGGDWHTHGSGGVEHAEETWFAVIGPDTKPTGEQKEEADIKASQFAKTLAAFLEMHFDTGKAKGVPIKSVMDNAE
ncbi:MAG: sulfatase-like hydrolase/transferase [Balneolaceae bacterium]